MSTKTKSAKAKKPQVKVQDIKPKKDAKAGGAILPTHNTGGGGGAG